MDNTFEIPVTVKIDGQLFYLYIPSQNGLVVEYWTQPQELIYDFNYYFNCKNLHLDKQDVIFLQLGFNCLFNNYSHMLPLITLNGNMFYNVLNEQKNYVFVNINDMKKNNNYVLLFYDCGYFILDISKENNIMNIQQNCTNNSMSTYSNVYEESTNSFVNSTVVVPKNNNYNHGIQCNALIMTHNIDLFNPIINSDRTNGNDYFDGIKFERECITDELECSELGLKLLSEFNVNCFDMTTRYLMINFLNDECSKFLNNNSLIKNDQLFTTGGLKYRYVYDNKVIIIHFLNWTKAIITDVNGIHVTYAYFHHDTHEFVCYNSLNTYLFDFIGAKLNKDGIGSVKFIFDDNSIDSINICKKTGHIYVHHTRSIKHVLTEKI